MPFVNPLAKPFLNARRKYLQEAYLETDPEKKKGLEELAQEQLDKLYGPGGVLSNTRRGTGNIPDTAGGRRRTHRTRRVKRKGTKAKKSRQSRQSRR
jgi:hypothetical protein